MKKITFFTAILLCTAMALQGQWTYTNLSEPKSSMGTTALGSKAWFAGGGNNSGLLSTVEYYDDHTGAWVVTNNLSVARYEPSMVACSSKIFFAGGEGDNGTVFSTVDIFDTLTGEWSVEELSVPRAVAVAVSYGNKVLFAGGVNAQLNRPYDIVDIYDVQTGEWDTASLSEPRGTWGTVVGDKAIFAGGYDFQKVSKRVDIYNFTTDTWSIDSLSVARCFVGVTAIGNKAVIAGGITADNFSSSVVDIYDATIGTWDIASLSFPRAFFDGLNSVTAGEKAFFIGGGILNLNTFLWEAVYDIIDIYDEAHDTWSVDNLANAFLGRSAVSLGDKFLVAGGMNMDGEYQSAVEIYTCPSSSCLPQGITFSTQAQINNFQTNHPTCIVIEGDVIINGNDINNLNGLNVLTSIGGDLTIYTTALVNLAGLENISSIGGNFSMGMYFMGCRGNNMLTNFTGLEALSSIGGDLNISCNEVLTGLPGLKNLNSIGGDLSITENPVLTTLTGLDSINSNSIMNLTIQDNALLSTCEVYSICHYLANPNGEINISGNATGCNSMEEVETICFHGIPPVVSRQSSVVSYPNPTGGVVNLQFTVYNLESISLRIYNAQGQEVAVVLDQKMAAGEHTVQWDAEGMPTGIYYYRLTTVNCQLPTVSGKIVKY